MPNNAKKALVHNMQMSAGTVAILRSTRVQMVAISWKQHQDARVVGDRMGSPRNPWGGQRPTYGGARGLDAHTTHRVGLWRGARPPLAEWFYELLMFADAEASIPE